MKIALTLRDAVLVIIVQFLHLQESIEVIFFVGCIIFSFFLVNFFSIGESKP